MCCEINCDLRFEAVNQKRSMRNWRCREARCRVYFFNWRCWNWKMNQIFGFVHFIEMYWMQTHQSFQLRCRHFSHNSQICAMGKGISNSKSIFVINENYIRRFRSCFPLLCSLLYLSLTPLFSTCVCVCVTECIGTLYVCFLFFAYSVVSTVILYSIKCCALPLYCTKALLPSRKYVILYSLFFLALVSFLPILLHIFLLIVYLESFFRWKERMNGFIKR